MEISKKIANYTNDNLGVITGKKKQFINQTIKLKNDSLEISNNGKSIHRLIQEEYSNYNYKKNEIKNSQNLKIWEKNERTDKERVYIFVRGKLIELPSVDKAEKKDEKTRIIDTEKENKRTIKTKYRIISLLDKLVEDEQNNRNKKEDKINGKVNSFIDLINKKN